MTHTLVHFTWPAVVCLWLIVFGTVLARFEYYRRAYLVLACAALVALVASP